MSPSFLRIARPEREIQKIEVRRGSGVQDFATIWGVAYFRRVILKCDLLGRFAFYISVSLAEYQRLISRTSRVPEQYSLVTLAGGNK